MLDAARLASTLYAHFNRHDFDSVLEHVASDCVIVLSALGLTFHGKEGFRQMMAMWKAPFPDGEVTLARQVASADGVANEGIYRATHSQPLDLPGGSLPASGRSIELPFCDVWHLRQGQIVTVHHYSDTATLLRQIGAMG